MWHFHAKLCLARLYIYGEKWDFFRSNVPQGRGMLDRHVWHIGPPTHYILHKDEKSTMYQQN